MAFMDSDGIGWHEGEDRMHALMHTPNNENPTSPFLSPGAAFLLQSSPLLAIGSLDEDGHPWTTLWGGETGFARSLGSSVIGVKTMVDMRHDPIIQKLLGDRIDGEVKIETSGRAVAGLAIDLASRRRVKLGGQMIAGALSRVDAASSSGEEKIGEIQMVIKIESSLGNCSKYLNKKRIVVSLPDPQLVSDALPLPDEAVQLLGKLDTFFLSASHHGDQLSTNNRGGSPGFVRVMSNNADGVTLVYPEYSGNRLYQTLGNLMTTPEAGFVFPDFDSGDVLYVTGTTEILVGIDAAAILPHSNLLVKVQVKGARFVKRGLPFRGERGELSPYNPPVRYLASERGVLKTQGAAAATVNARILKREMLTPTIARFRFQISDISASGRWAAGQHVALSFEDQLSLGYSHMRDDDPKSLNDDYIRTFTISSPPTDSELRADQFEITVRNVGVATNFMFQVKTKSGLELPLKGFGGEFVIHLEDQKIVPFVAGGIGITPILGQVLSLDLAKIRLFWAVNIDDLGLVTDTCERTPSLARSTTLFVSGINRIVSKKAKAALAGFEAAGVTLETRRLQSNDLESESGLSNRWYICTGTALKRELMQWLVGKEVLYEDFNY